jgi:N,N'-diacetyllegionaminate synthase
MSSKNGEHYEAIPWFMRGYPNREHKTLVVAEIGNNHEGSLGNLIYMIEWAAFAGADAIKIQCHIPSAESTDYEGWPRRFAYHPQDPTRCDYWQRMFLDGDALQEIQKACDRLHIKLIASCFSVEALKMVLVNCPNIWALKIASGEADNKTLIQAIHTAGKRVILSTGMSDTREVNANVCDLLAEPKIPELYVLQCTTEYPVPWTQIGLNVCECYSRNLLFKGGLSDHSGTIYPSIIAAYLGANMVEVHVCFSKKQFGADIESSITFEELEHLTKGVAIANCMLNHPINKDLYQPCDDAKVYREGKVRL